MATLTRRKTGSWVVQFELDGRRRSIGLGKIPRRTAQEIRRRIEYLVAAKRSATPIDGATAQWLAQIDASLHDRLAAVGLAPRRATTTLGQWLQQYFDSRPDVKPATLVVWKQVRKDLEDFFRPDRVLSTITQDEAEAFRRHLAERLSDTTVHKRLQFCRQFFREAIRRGLVETNPFQEVRHRAGSPADRQHYVTIEVTERLIEAAPDWQWRTILALAR